ncbi:TRAP transporter small permease [Erysipelotrichaceae bacterium 66-17]
MKVFAVIRKVLDRFLKYACIFLFAMMTCIATYQIITRYFFNAPSTVSEELLTYSFAWMALLASALVFGKRDHMRMAFLADKIHGKAKQILDIAIEILIFVFAVLVLIWGGSSIMNLSMTQATASLGVPMGYLYIALPLSGVCIALYSICNIVDMCHGKDLKLNNGFEEKGDLY